MHVKGRRRREHNCSVEIYARILVWSWDWNLLVQIYHRKLFECWSTRTVIIQRLSYTLKIKDRSWLYAGAVSCFWLSRISAIAIILYICNIFHHWLELVQPQRNTGLWLQTNMSPVFWFYACPSVCRALKFWAWKIFPYDMDYGNWMEIRYQDPSALARSKMAEAANDSNVYTAISYLWHIVSRVWNWIECDWHLVLLCGTQIYHRIWQNCSKSMNKLWRRFWQLSNAILVTAFAAFIGILVTQLRPLSRQEEHINGVFVWRVNSIYQWHMIYR